MKNILTLFSIIITLLLFAACNSSSTNYKTFEVNEDGFNETVTFYYTNNIVEREEVESTYHYDAYEINDANEALEVHQPYIESLNEIDGVSASVHTNNEAITEFITIDHTIASQNKLNEVLYDMYDSSSEKLNMDAVESQLLSHGYTLTDFH